MTTMTRIRRRGLWMVATVVLLLTLALAACGGHGQQSGDLSSANAGATTDTSGAPSDAVSTDDDLQQMVATLDSVQTDTSLDLSSSDNEVQP